MRLGIFLLLVSSILIPVFQVNAQSTQGALVKAGSPSVYYVTDNKRFVFPNSNIYHSWYPGFSSVTQISDQQLQEYPVGENIRYRSGTRLVKITSDPRVYAVGFDGALYPIRDEAAAIELYGENWASLVDDLPDAFFSGYEIQERELDGSAYPPGSVIRNSLSEQLYLLVEENGETKIRVIARNKEEQLGMRARYIHEVSSPDYPIAQQTGRDIASFQNPVHIEDAAPVDIPDGTEQEETASPDSEEADPERADTDATVSIKRENTIGLEHIVRDAPQATVLEFSFQGDQRHDTRISEIPLLFYIDTGKADQSDFERGTDVDQNITWGIDQLLRDIRIRDKATGEILSESSTTNGYSLLRMPVNLTVPAGEKRTLEVMVSHTSVPTPIPRFSVDVDTSEIAVSSLSAESVAVSGQEFINGGTTPQSIATFIEHGELAVRTVSMRSDDIRYFDQQATPFHLRFTAYDEPINLRNVSIVQTDLTDEPLLIEDVELLIEQDGETFARSFERFEDNERYIFTDLNISLPEEQPVDIPVRITFASYDRQFSNKRAQVSFSHHDFFATAEYSRHFFSESAFGSVEDDTATGPVYRLRNGEPIVSRAPESPSGQKGRFSTTDTFSFTVEAINSGIALHKLTFKVETSNVGEEGAQNDYLELLGQTNAREASKLFVKDRNAEQGRVRRGAQEVTYGIYRPSEGVVTDLDNFETRLGDYGIFVYNFGTSPFRLSEGQKRTFTVALDTSVLPSDVSANLRVGLLGNSDFRWDDESKILANGTYIQGLPVSGALLNFPDLN